MVPQILQFLERAGPIGAQQAGKTAIGEHAAAGLAGRAIVGFVVRVTDAENLRAAPGTRFSIGHLYT